MGMNPVPAPSGPDANDFQGDAGSLNSGVGVDVSAELGVPISKPDDTTQKSKVKLLIKRIAKAKKAKRKWVDDFQIDRAHDYFKGFQRSEDDEFDAQGDRRYQINKIMAAMKSKIPRIFYYHPYYRVTGARGRDDTPAETVHARAQLLQDTLNTIICQRETRFKPECLMALKEAQWAFGVVEVGYTADWADNPFVQKPTLVENDEVQKDLVKMGDIPDPESDSPEDILSAALQKLTKIPEKETFYVKHVPANQFYVASNDHSSIEEQDWVAYWEWVYVEDVKRTEGYQNVDDLKPSAKAEGTDPDVANDPDLLPLGDERDTPADMVRLWRMWDQREKKRYVIADGHDSMIMESNYTYLPLFDLRLEVLPGEYYPYPPITSQLTEQDETNDAREWFRLLRKGTRPRFMYDKAAFDKQELEKLETDEFNTMVAVQNGNMSGITPVQQPSFSEAAVRTLGMADASFSEQAASSPQARLTRDGGAPTAQEVMELASSGDVRDSYEQQEVANWLGRIGYGILRCAIEKMTLPMWISLNTDPHSPAAQLDAMVVAQTYQQITYDTLSGADDSMKWDVAVDIESMSPVTEQQYVSRIMQVLGMLSSPGVGGLLSLAPSLLKLVLNMLGIRNGTDVNSILQALQARAQQEQAMAMAGAGRQPGLAPQSGAPSPNQSKPGPQGAPGPPGNGSPQRPQPPKHKPGGSGGPAEAAAAGPSGTNVQPAQPPN